MLLLQCLVTTLIQERGSSHVTIIRSRLFNFCHVLVREKLIDNLSDLDLLIRLLLCRRASCQMRSAATPIIVVNYDGSVHVH
jgi:hypothetical protein